MYTLTIFERNMCIILDLILQLVYSVGGNPKPIYRFYRKIRIEERADSRAVTEKQQISLYASVYI